MALLRLSCCPNAAPVDSARAEWALFAPESDGAWVADGYDPYRRCGMLAELRGDLRTPLVDHLQRERSLILPELASDAPVCVMIHGFQYDPRAPLSHDRGRAANPHAQIFHFDEDDLNVERHAHSSPWPLRLGFDEDDGESGLAVGFGWASDPTYARGDWRDWLSTLRWSEVGAETYYATAYRTAPIAAEGLTRTITALAEVFPNRRIDLFAHSLGARVALFALRRLAEENRVAELDRVGRVVLLSGAPHWLDARLALRALAEHNRSKPQIFNIVVSRDATLSRWGRRFAAFAGRLDERPKLRDRLWSLVFGGKVIGLHGKPQGAQFSAWMDLHLDLPALANWASRLDPPLDFRPTWRGASWDHWAGFTWPPYMQFYGNILRKRRDWSLNALRWGAGRRKPIPQGRTGRGPMDTQPRELLRLRAFFRLVGSKLGLGRKSE
jgi:hypothetical protein